MIPNTSDAEKSISNTIRELARIQGCGQVPLSVAAELANVPYATAWVAVLRLAAARRLYRTVMGADVLVEPVAVAGDALEPGRAVPTGGARSLIEQALADAYPSGMRPRDLEVASGKSSQRVRQVLTELLGDHLVEKRRGARYSATAALVAQRRPGAPAPVVTQVHPAATEPPATTPQPANPPTNPPPTPKPADPLKALRDEVFQRVKAADGEPMPLRAEHLPMLDAIRADPRLGTDGMSVWPVHLGAAPRYRETHPGLVAAVLRKGSSCKRSVVEAEAACDGITEPVGGWDAWWSALQHYKVVVLEGDRVTMGRTYLEQDGYHYRMDL